MSTFIHLLNRPDRAGDEAADAPAQAGGPDPRRDDAPLPCPQRLLACTVALMSAWATPESRDRADQDAVRSLIARKLVAQLASLMTHPALGEPMRQVMAQARQRWLPLAGSALASQGAGATGQQAAEPAWATGLAAGSARH
jgi:hypothetical protein